MAIIENWLPPSKENWEIISYLWQFFPLVTIIQWLVDFYPQGKTSIVSSLNIPGKIGWATMEAPGFITLLYIVYTLPASQNITSLPLANWIMVGLFVTHYIYRALLAPLVLNPSMSPIHVLVWAAALSFQLCNAISIGGWLGGYGPVSDADWAGRSWHLWVPLGMVVWAAGFVGNIYHDDELRAIRRRAAGKTKEAQEKESVNGRGSGKGEDLGKRKEKTKSVDKVYMIPQNGLFRVILYPHYLCEWIEWAGFWMIGGPGCVPARSFLVNEISTMLPRALQGRKWYLARFGREQVGKRKAVVPGVL